MSHEITKHYIAGVEIAPDNSDSIGFKIDFTEDFNKPQLNVSSIVLSGEAKRLVLNHYHTYGAYQGLAYNVKIGSNTLEYFIDFTKDIILSGTGDSSIEVSIVKRKSVQSFSEKAKSTSWQLVNDTHPILPTEIEYIIERDDIAIQVVVLGMNVFSLGESIISNTKALAENIADISDGSIPDPLTAVAPPTAVVGVALKPSSAAAAVAKAVAQSLYLTGLTVAMIVMLVKIFRLFVPAVKSIAGATSI